MSLLAVVAVPACGAEPAVRTGEDDVTQVPTTSVKEQAIGNCWIYTTLGWVESLHLARTGETLNLSESYVTYLHWFERLVTEREVFSTDGTWQTGDFFGSGAEIVSRYGLLDEAAFLPSEASLDRSARQARAVEVVKAALRPGGELATRAERADPVRVRALLDRAFGLSPELSASLTVAFGADLARTRQDGAKLGGRGWHDPASMRVARTKDGHDVTLDEALGELDPDREVRPGRDRRERRGPYAWRRVEIDSPATLEAVGQRMKATLNAGFPVPMDWYVSWPSRRAGGAFTPPAVVGQGGWHETMATDYEITLASGQVLRAGVPVTDPALLAQTLAPGAKLSFVRMKNSWGRDEGPFDARGFTDTSWGYLGYAFVRPSNDYDRKVEPGVVVSAMILPPPTWDGAAHRP